LVQLVLVRNLGRDAIEEYREGLADMYTRHPTDRGLESGPLVRGFDPAWWALELEYVAARAVKNMYINYYFEE